MSEIKGRLVIHQTVGDRSSRVKKYVFSDSASFFSGLTLKQKREVVDKFNNHDRLVEENQHLTAIATKNATLNDERYELLEKQKSDIEKMLDQLFEHEKVDAWLVCKMNDMLDDVNHQLDKSRIEAEKGDGICN